MMGTEFGRSGADAPSGHPAEPEPSSTVSAVPVSVPNAARSTVANTICKPFTVNGNVITSANIARAIDMLANLPDEFAAFRLATTLLPEGSGWDRQEATNRLMQRWRKLGLVSFGRRWSLARGAWDKLQASAIEARRAATENTGAVHESAVAKPDAQGSTHD